MLTVHHLNNSQSERIVWLCEELGVPYDLKLYARTAEGAAPPEYKALHPTGTAPIVTDGDFALAESGAIIEYIARRHGGGRLILGPEHPDFADFLFWFHYGNGSLLPAYMMNSVATRLGSKPLSRRVDIAFALAEARLGDVTWFAGNDFTTADIMMAQPLGFDPAFTGADLAAFPNIRAYLARVAERPAYRAAIAKAEPERVLA
jgi:glutathione S-transferase